MVSPPSTPPSMPPGRGCGPIPDDELCIHPGLGCRWLIATGAGAELRQALGTAVFFGMLGVTGFGLVFTPTFYVVSRALGDRIARLRGRTGGHQGELAPRSRGIGVPDMKLARFLTASLSALALSACAAGPDYVAPIAPQTSSGPFLSQSGAVSTAPVATDWWKLYNDPVLDGLIQDALTANTDIRVAVAHLEKARAALSGARADKLPQTPGRARAPLMAEYRSPSARPARRWRTGRSMAASASPMRSICSAA